MTVSTYPLRRLKLIESVESTHWRNFLGWAEGVPYMIASSRQRHWVWIGRRVLAERFASLPIYNLAIEVFLAPLAGFCSTDSGFPSRNYIGTKAKNSHRIKLGSHFMTQDGDRLHDSALPLNYASPQCSWTGAYQSIARNAIPVSPSYAYINHLHTTISR